MGSDAPSTIELAVVDCNGLRLRGAVPRASAVGPHQPAGQDARAHAHLSMLYW